MKKNIDELTDAELQAELVAREKKRRDTAQRAARKAAKEAQKKVSRIEMMFTEAAKAHRKALEEVQRMEDELERKRRQLAEDFAMPTRIGRGDEYVPNSIVKWEDEDAFTPEELEWVRSKLSREYYGYTQVSPGEYWTPSEYC